MKQRFQGRHLPECRSRAQVLEPGQMFSAVSMLDCLHGLPAEPNRQEGQTAPQQAIVGNKMQTAVVGLKGYSRSLHGNLHN